MAIESKTLALTLLALLLITGQTSFASHDVEHLFDADEHVSCELCLIGSNLNNIHSDPSPTQLFTYQFHRFNIHSDQQAVAQLTFSFYARAPPPALLH